MFRIKIADTTTEQFVDRQIIKTKLKNVTSIDDYSNSDVNANPNISSGDFWNYSTMSVNMGTDGTYYNLGPCLVTGSIVAKNSSKPGIEHLVFVPIKVFAGLGGPIDYVIKGDDITFVVYNNQWTGESHFTTEQYVRMEQEARGANAITYRVPIISNSNQGIIISSNTASLQLEVVDSSNNVMNFNFSGVLFPSLKAHKTEDGGVTRYYYWFPYTPGGPMNRSADLFENCLVGNLNDINNLTRKFNLSLGELSNIFVSR